MSETKDCANETKPSSGGFSDYLKRFAGLSRENAPKPGAVSKPMTVKTTHLDREDSIPEIVSSPTDVGIYEVGHQGEKLTWKKFFESGKSGSEQQ